MIANNCFKFLLVIFSIGTLSTAQQLPKYIKPCSISDTNVNQCLINHGNDALKVLLKGDKYLQIATFIPTWTIPKLGGQLSEKVKFIQTNTLARKFETLKIVNATFNTTENSLLFQTDMPVLEFTARYDMDVDVLGKRITGRGNMNATLENVSYVFKIFLSTETRDESEYYIIKKSTFDIHATKASFLFNKLFNGDKIKGEEANKFINDNWIDFMGAIASSWIDFMNSFTPKLFHKFMRIVPKDKFLLP